MKIILALMFALACTAADAKSPSHQGHSATKSAHPGVPDKHWVPGYGDDRTCHGACLTAPFWSNALNFFGAIANQPAERRATFTPKSQPSSISKTRSCSGSPNLCQ